MKINRLILAILIAQTVLFFAASSVLCQTETLDIVTYTPPKGWAKTVKSGAVVLTDINQNKNTFCLLTVYAGAVSSGSPSTDFTNDWNEFVIKPFKAGPSPKTQLQSTPDGWQVSVGGANIDLDGGVKAAAILTVFSGFGKTASVLVIFNDDSYSEQASALIDGIKLDKTPAVTQTQPAIPTDTSMAGQRDPFPDKPFTQPQKPLAGPLKESITMADLVGTWDNGGASVTTYVDSSSGNYSGTDTSFFTENYTIKSDGTFEHRFQGRASNHTVREVDGGTVALSGGYITLKFTAGERHGSYRYQFVSYMTLPNGGAVLTFIHIGDNDKGYTPEQLYYNCSHAQGYITCIVGDTWVLRVAKR
ncbi:MAG: hypothetical protein ABI878_02995 [Acidobacteriota bacterium]